MSAMALPAFKRLEEIDEDKTSLEDCIRRMRVLEERVGYTAKSHRRNQMSVVEARKRLVVLQQRATFLRGDH